MMKPAFSLALEDITSSFGVYNLMAIQELVRWRATLLDYQDIGVLLPIRQDRLHITHGLGWIVVACGTVLLVLKILLKNIKRSRIEVRNQRLIQRVAMLETDLTAQPKTNKPSSG